MTKKHYFFLLALILALAVRFPISEDVFHANSLSAFAWLFPLMGWIFVLVFYGVLRMVVSNDFAMIFTVAFAFFTPMILASRTPAWPPLMLIAIPVIFFVVAVLASFFWRSEKEWKRSLSVVTTTFVIAFTTFHLVHWDGLFVREYAGMHKQVESLAETLKDKSVFIIQPINGLDLQLFDVTTFPDQLKKLEATNTPAYVLSDGDAYKDTLASVKNIVYRMDGTQKIAANASANIWLPLTMEPVVHEMNLVKVAGSLGKL